LETGEVRSYNEAGIALREYEDLAVRDVMSVSKMIQRGGIHTIVVNTNPHLFGRETYGFAVTELIASLTNGTLHTVGRIATKEGLVEGIVDKIAADQRMIAHDASLSMKPL